jgi:hypothetical protein
MGAVTLVCSYTIYGISTEHMPVIDTWLNRVNLGGSLGASLIMGGLLGLFLDHASAIKRTLRLNIFAVAVALMSGALILVDWQFAKPWITSWQAQRELMVVLRSHAAEIQPGDSLIIGGIIRYASKWAPVVDGVWDFQSMARITLNDKTLRGTVLTERLTMTKEALVDSYGKIVLGTFPFKQMILYAPKRGLWVHVFSRDEFIKQSKQLGWAVADSKTN